MKYREFSGKELREKVTELHIDVREWTMSQRNPRERKEVSKLLVWELITILLEHEDKQVHGLLDHLHLRSVGAADGRPQPTEPQEAKASIFSTELIPAPWADEMECKGVVDKVNSEIQQIAADSIDCSKLENAQVLRT